MFLPFSSLFLCGTILQSRRKPAAADRIGDEAGPLSTCRAMSHLLANPCKVGGSIKSASMVSEPT